MWHFGIDTIDEYTNKEFKVTFEEGISDVYRIYTKRMKKDGKNTVRVEHQEYPNQEYADAIVKKLFPNGHLIDVNSSTAKEERT
jgi:phage/plasmid-associated DNA primase